MKPAAPQQHHSPWLAKKLPFYYGWVMLPIAMLAMAATSPGQTFGVSVFNPALRANLNLSHAQLTGAYMFGTLLAAFPQPYIGALMDRYGIRRVMTVVTLLFGAACVFMAGAQNLGMLFIAFFFLRLLGQGALNLLAGNIPAMWFKNNLGKVSGLVNVGMAIATAVLPPFFLGLIHQFGWRGAYRILGILVGATLLPILATVFRNRPEEVGQHLDGAIPNPTIEIQPQMPEIPSMDVKSAQKTRAYWILLVFVTIWAMIVTAIFFNIIPVFTSQGITETQAAATFSTLAISSVITQLLAGSLADRAPLNGLLSIGTATLIAAIIFLSQAAPVWIAHGYAVTMGITQGLLGVAMSTLWARYYGREHLGKIRGRVFTATVAGSSAGPFIMGWMFDQFGSYQLSLWIFVGLLIPMVFANLWATPPKTPVPSH